MKQLITLTLFIAIGLTACDNATNKTEVTTTTDSSMGDTMSTTTDPPTGPVDSATMMQNWMAYMTPGDVHKMMESWNGTWNGEVTMWHVPDAPPEVSNATTTNKMILGGRYQQSTSTGNMMGQPFEGISTVAYDNAAKMFTSTWIDNMGTGMMVLTGPWNEATKTMMLSGKMIDPSAGNAKEMQIRETFQIIDDKNQLMEMFGPGPDGKEYKMLSIKYTRK